MYALQLRLRVRQSQAHRQAQQLSQRGLCTGAENHMRTQYDHPVYERCDRDFQRRLVLAVEEFRQRVERPGFLCLYGAAVHRRTGQMDDARHTGVNGRLQERC